jgi:hypothetical protein
MLAKLIRHPLLRVALALYACGALVRLSHLIYVHWRPRPVLTLVVVYGIDALAIGCGAYGVVKGFRSLRPKSGPPA